MYVFGAQLGHENGFLFHVEDFTSEFGNLGNELEDKLLSKDIYRKIYENISSVILQVFRECGRDQPRQKRSENNWMQRFSLISSSSRRSCRNTIHGSTGSPRTVLLSVN